MGNLLRRVSTQRRKGVSNQISTDGTVVPSDVPQTRQSLHLGGFIPGVKSGGLIINILTLVAREWI